MNFLSRNCRGFVKRSKAESLKDLKILTKPSVILLQETKMEDSFVLETTKKDFKNCGGVVVSSQGTSVGIATLWEKQIWNLEVTLNTQHCLLIVLKNRNSSNIISVINVYIPNIYVDKARCCNSLSVPKNSMDLPSCIIRGDFNTCLNSGEKKGGSKVRDPFSKKLFDVILDWYLQDVKPSKGK
jgi:exonuclease III